jgi:hypothetical protein
MIRNHLFSGALAAAGLTLSTASAAQHEWRYLGETTDGTRAWAWITTSDEPFSLNWITLHLSWSNQWEGGYIDAWSPVLPDTDGIAWTDKGTHTTANQHFFGDDVTLPPGLHAIAFVELTVGAAYGMGYTDSGSVGGDDVVWINGPMNDGTLRPIIYACDTIADFWEHLPSVLVEEHYSIDADIDQDGDVDWIDRGHVNQANPDWCQGDTNADFRVDDDDLGTVLAAFGAVYGDPSFRFGADLNADLIVNHTDLVMVLTHYGEGLD